MDQLREFFYWSVSIAAILMGLLVLAAFVLMAYIKNVVDRTAKKLDWQMSEATRHFRNMTWARTIVRFLRLIF